MKENKSNYQMRIKTDFTWLKELWISPCLVCERWGNVKTTHLLLLYGNDSALHTVHTKSKPHLFTRILLNIAEYMREKKIQGPWNEFSLIENLFWMYNILLRINYYFIRAARSNCEILPIKLCLQEQSM